MSMKWYATKVKRMEEGKWVDERHGNPIMSNPDVCYVPVALYTDYEALQAEVARLRSVFKANSEWRLRRIAELIAEDAPVGSEVGRLLNALADEQVEAERDIKL